MKLKELFETAEKSFLSVYGEQPDPGHGDFVINNLRLTSLAGMPKVLHGGVSCGTNNLETLYGAPEKVSDKFSCRHNKLTSLKGAPKSVGGYFNCEDNLISSLEGAPNTIAGVFYCSGNKLTSLKGIHKQIKYIGDFATFDGNPIKSHMLGLLKIDGLRHIYYIDNKPVQNIINKHLKGDKDIFACQEELIEAGFPEFAQL
jgi:hypothetical protein